MNQKKTQNRDGFSFLDRGCSIPTGPIRGGGDGFEAKAVDFEGLPSVEVLRQAWECFLQAVDGEEQAVRPGYPHGREVRLVSEELLFTRLASIPGRTEAFWKELDYVKSLWKNRQELKVEDAGIAALFGLECLAWFCAGEIVGRGFTITGYYV